jgi:hypothetical protein
MFLTYRLQHLMYVTHPCSPKAVGTRLADRIGIATTTSTLLRHLMLVDKQAGIGRKNYRFRPTFA